MVVIMIGFTTPIPEGHIQVTSNIKGYRHQSHTARRVFAPIFGDRRRGGFDLRGDGWTVSRCGVPRRHGRIAPPRPRPVLRPGIDFSLSFAFGLKAGLPDYRPAP